MGILDYFRKPASPATVRRSEPRLRVKRGYSAGVADRLTHSWSVSHGSADEEIRGVLRMIRARARDLAVNQDYVKRFLSLIEVNVVGKAGIIVKPAARRKPGGELDEPDNKLTAAAWSRWAARGVCEITGKYSFPGLQRQVIRSVARDGEVLLRIHRGPSAGNVFNFALELIEADRLDQDKWQVGLPGGAIIKMGVEKAANGRPVAYHILREHPGERLGLSSYSDRIPADQIIHVYNQDRVGQSRGVSWLYSAILRLKMLDGYEEAELVAARTAAAKMGFFVSPDGEGQPVDDVSANGDYEIDAEAGTFGRLPAGVDFRPWDPQHPTSSFPNFCKAVLRGISAGLGVSYHALSTDLEGANYSSLRQGALDERDQYSVLQCFLIDELIEPVWKAWIRTTMVSGVLPFPMRTLEKHEAAMWRPRGWSWVDPLKEVNANKEAVQAGFKSRQDVMAETGRDFTETLEELRDEANQAEAAGVSFTAMQQSEGSDDAENGNQKDDD